MSTSTNRTWKVHSKVRSLGTPRTSVLNMKRRRRSRIARSQRKRILSKGEVYWIVERLRRMQPREHIPVADFIGFGQRKPSGKSFPPHRPLLVEHPL